VNSDLSWVRDGHRPEHRNKPRFVKLNCAVSEDEAFRGELVPTEAELARQEGREYEPASVLFERIRKERQQAKSVNCKSVRQGKTDGALRVDQAGG
jgi:hypothetical protein